MNTYRLKLYIIGQSTNSDLAIANLKQIFEETQLDYELSIIDVLEYPELAEKDKVMATPTLIKLSPLPVRRIVGDFSDRDRVIIGLGLFNPTQANL